MRRTLVVLIGLIVLGSVASACSAPAKTDPQAGQLAPLAMLPKEMQAAPARVRTAYQFAVTHPDALKNVPCYCGCGGMGHTSNLSCYIKQFGADGKPIFDDHALGCSLCVDIAQDVMRMTGEGKTPADIRAQIVATYANYGPGNQ